MCTLNLVGDENEKFEKFWQDTVAQQTKEVAQKALVYIEGEIKCREMESNSVRTQTLQKICKHSINFEQEKRQFDEQITKLHEEQINETVISEIN